MKKYKWLIVIMISAICMGINIEWNVESIKSFITGGVLMWMAMRFYKL